MQLRYRTGEVRLTPFQHVMGLTLHTYKKQKRKHKRYGVTVCIYVMCPCRVYMWSIYICISFKNTD